MKKIPTLFLRDPDNMRRVLPDVNPTCQWVLDGEGVPTRKWDGTCVLIRDGRMFARREVKPGKKAPADFELVEHDEQTGKSVGWVPVTDTPEYARHWEAFTHWDPFDLAPGWRAGTYELVGPKVNGNPERLPRHDLVLHGMHEMTGVPRDFDGLRAWLLDRRPDIEGIVWWREPGNPDSDMAKLKRRDFDA